MDILANKNLKKIFVVYLNFCAKSKLVPIIWNNKTTLVECPKISDFYYYTLLRYFIYSLYAWITFIIIQCGHWVLLGLDEQPTFKDNVFHFACCLGTTSILIVEGFFVFKAEECGNLINKYIKLTKKLRKLFPHKKPNVSVFLDTTLQFSMLYSIIIIIPLFGLAFFMLYPLPVLYPLCDIVELAPKSVQPIWITLMPIIITYVVSRLVTIVIIFTVCGSRLAYDTLHYTKGIIYQPTNIAKPEITFKFNRWIQIFEHFANQLFGSLAAVLLVINFGAGIFANFVLLEHDRQLPWNVISLNIVVLLYSTYISFYGVPAAGRITPNSMRFVRSWRNYLKNNCNDQEKIIHLVFLRSCSPLRIHFGPFFYF